MFFLSFFFFFHCFSFVYISFLTFISFFNLMDVFLDFINVFGRFNINWLFVILFLTALFIFIFMLPFHPLIITWGNRIFEVEAPS